MESNINKSIKELKKTTPLRILMALNAMMMFLPFVFYFVIIKNNFEVGVDPTWMLYTGLGYIVSFSALVFFVLTRNILGLRIVIGINVIIAIPVSAFIGWIVVIVSIVLSFNKKVKAYFAP